jgi:pyridoxal/pyridoxine/pyridoxamine kinase
MLLCPTGLVKKPALFYLIFPVMGESNRIVLKEQLYSALNDKVQS